MRCIYCLKDDLEVTFNREHIIPQNIGGKLFMDDVVCKSCNSYLGANIDNEILKIPIVLDALKRFNISQDSSLLLNAFYKIKGTLNGITLRARATASGFEIIDQNLLDGSILSSDDKIEDKIKRIIHRDKRLKSAGISRIKIDSEIEDLLKTYRKSKPGERVEWPKLGIISF